MFNFPPNAGATGIGRAIWRCSKVVCTPRSSGSSRRGLYGRFSRRASRRCARRSLHRQCRAVRRRCQRRTRAFQTDDHVRREKHLAQIEAQWGPAPGQAAEPTAARHPRPRCAVFGKVFVGVQPAFWLRGRSDAAAVRRAGLRPTHAFSAFYRWLREDFGASCGVAFRHAWRAGVHARQAGRDDRRPAGPSGSSAIAPQFLPLRRQQPVRGD